MKKRRLTLNLDEDIVEGLHEVNGSSISSSANAILRRGIEHEAHRQAMRRWVRELDERYGSAPLEEAAQIEAFLDALGNGSEPAQPSP